MSRILRRPMFRGGPVSSYGTGIASGLAEGGRVNLYRGGGPKRKTPTLKRDTIMPWDLGTYADRTRGGPGAMYQGIGGPMWTGSEIMNFIKDNPKWGGMNFANTLSGTLNPETGRYEGGKKYAYDATSDAEMLSLMRNMMDPDLPLMDPDKTAEENTTIDTEEIWDDHDAGNKEKIEEVKTTKKEENSKVPPNIIIDKGEEIINDESTEAMKIEEMADKYFELMGGKKARGRDVSDMLLRFAGAEGDTTMEKFQKFAGEESKVKSRTEDLKEKATGFAIQQSAQLDMLQKKLDSAESIAEKNLISQQIRDLNKTYAPGITQKDITYGSSLKKGSAEHTMYLRKNKLSPSLVDEVATRKNAKDTTGIGTYMSLSEVNALGPVYYTDWQGIFNPETSTSDGTYLDVEKKKIIQFKGGELISEENIAIE